MNKTNKLKRRWRRFLVEKQNFGLYIAFTNAVWPCIHHLPSVMAEFIMSRKHDMVFEYIQKVIGNRIFTYQSHAGIMETEHKGKIWLCWLQGEDSMPEVVKYCLNSIRKNANGHPVIVITLGNYAEYCTIPHYIIKLHDEGKIGHAHFTDIIRTCLLYEKGGVWIDATMLVTKGLPFSLFDSNFYSCKFPNHGYYVTKCRWSNFFLCAKAGSPMFDFVRMCFFEYLKKEVLFIDYFMMDYFMCLGYEHVKEIREAVEHVPMNNIQIHSLSHMVNKPCDENDFKRFIAQDTFLFKLSWKSVYKETANGHPTYWKQIKQKYCN